MQQIYRWTSMPKCDFNKVACSFIEITLCHGCSPVNLLHIFRAPFPKNTFGRLILYFIPQNLFKDICQAIFIKTILRLSLVTSDFAYAQKTYFSKIVSIILLLIFFWKICLLRICEIGQTLETVWNANTSDKNRS